MAKLVDLPAGRQARRAKYTNVMYFVYILKSLSSNFYYKGTTNNLPRRLTQHYNGQSPSTRKRLPLKLIHVEICQTRKEAREIEKFFKSGFGREIIYEIELSLD